MDKSVLQKMFSSNPEKFYEVGVLKEFGFTRKKCKKCGNYFWSLTKQTCGDTKCEGGYNFVGNPDRGWDFLTTIEKWERFFEKNRHKVIEPYPVVARWRKDLHFVIASIADFQPWVLNGVAEAPGNPLVVSQPCMRFNDLDNVGRTGRHFSLFFMGGQHAFNMPNYWINETLTYGFRFLTDVMKINAEDITYREDVWKGGGNFGPSMEAFAHGSELVNHVFMQFEETPLGYKEMNRRVIDTGWGLERLAWYASGKSNAYESIFPHIAKLRQDLGINVDFKSEFWNQIGLYDVSDGLKLPQNIKKILEETKPLQDLYKILDHTRALTFALADGAIPSNVGGGYNLRVLLRRAQSLIDSNKFDITIEELIKNHARYYGRRFKNMKNLPDIDDIIGIEKHRYTDSMKKGSELVKKYLKQGIVHKKLAELYESHGVPPETVREISEKQGKIIKIPDDFYLKFNKEKKKLKKHKPIRDLPESKLLYYLKPPEEAFDAVILWSKGREVVLSETQFYPLSGGQEGDEGTLTWSKGTAKVVKTYKEGKAVVHLLDRDAPAKEVKIKGRVDVVRRRDLMRHHTAVHIVNGAALKVLGKHVWQAGAEKTTEKARLDITHYKPITREEIKKIERISNSIVLENLKIRKMELPRTEAEQRFGFRLYQGGAVPGAKLRTINIPGHDAEACGGTHCDYTGEVGMIKILDTKRIQDGVVRLDLIAGMRSLEKTWENEKLIEKTSQVLGTDSKDMDKGVEKLQRRIKIFKLSVTQSGAKGGLLLKGDKIKWGLTNLPIRDMQEVVKKFIKNKKAEMIIISNKRGDISVASDGKISAVDVAKDISSELGSGAGGNKTIARGGARDLKRIGEVIRKVVEKYS